MGHATINSPIAIFQSHRTNHRIPTIYTSYILGTTSFTRTHGQIGVGGGLPCWVWIANWRRLFVERAYRSRGRRRRTLENTNPHTHTKMQAKCHENAEQGLRNDFWTNVYSFAYIMRYPRITQTPWVYAWEWKLISGIERYRRLWFFFLRKRFVGTYFGSVIKK